jgi:hypothetical protein
VKKILMLVVAGLFLFGYSALFAQNLEIAEFKQVGDEQITHTSKADAVKKLDQLEKRDKVIVEDFLKKEDKKYISTETPDPEKALNIYNGFKGAMVRISDIYNPKTNISVKIYQVIIPQ